MFKLSNKVLFLFAIVLLASEAFAAKVDPTGPFGRKASTTTTPDGQKIVLESIIRGEGIHTVVISGKVLKVLDYIGEFQLTAVNEQSVILRSKTQRLKLDVFKSNIVKPSVVK